MKNLWTVRFSILIGFVAFDLLSTRYFITAVTEEGNSYARLLMQTFGISLGLILFSLVIAGVLALILCLSRLILAKTDGPVEFGIILFLDLGFAWTVAGSHFMGGTSWFWLAPEMIRGLLGAGLYLAVLYSILLAVGFRKPGGV